MPRRRKHEPYIYKAVEQPLERLTVEEYERRYGDLPAVVRRDAEAVNVRGDVVQSIELSRLINFQSARVRED